MRTGGMAGLVPEVRIYTTSYCVFCRRAKALLERRDAAYEEIDVSSDTAKRTWLVEASGGRRTVPVVFIGERCVGGYDELAELDRAGELEGLLDGGA